MAVTPQTPKCHHNLGYASVVVTFGSLWCHSHDLKLGINSFNNERFALENKMFTQDGGALDCEFISFKL